jgi:hypothetical protein
VPNRSARPMDKLAYLTLSGIEVPDRILEPLTHALSSLPMVLNHLGEWHQNNFDRADNPSVAFGVALRLYETAYRADHLFTDVGHAWVNADHIEWQPGQQPHRPLTDRTDRLPSPSSFGTNPEQGSSQDPSRRRAQNRWPSR